jgi:hypothetical protein
MFPEKPLRLETMIDEVPELDPLASVRNDGLALIVKSGGGELGTTTVTFKE